MGNSRWFFSFSGTIILAGAIAISTLGINFGIDFTSGTRITAPTERAATVAQVRSALSRAGFSDAQVQQIKDPKLGKNVVQISLKKLDPARVTSVETALNNNFGVRSGNFTVSSVGPTFGQQIARTAAIAIIASLLLISIYIGLRFEFKYAVPVLIALAHDLLITSGVYALTSREVTTSTVAALLTILGYSLYDTIIVFDRIRENVPRMPRATFSQIVNRSMSEVLTRSLMTSLSTLIPIAALMFFGGSTLKDFGFALLIGVASGAYSSIFIASPVLTAWKEREPVWVRRRRLVEQDHGGVVPAYAESELGTAEPAVPAPRPRRTPATPGGPRRAAAGAAVQDPPITGDGDAERTEQAEEPARPARTSSTGSRPKPRGGDGDRGRDGQSERSQPDDPLKARREARRRRRHGRPR